MSLHSQALNVKHELFKLNVEAESDAPLRITFDSAFFIGLLGATFFIRAFDVLYNTLFVDEANYVLVGRHLLAGDFSDNGLSWISGSYLYPYLAGIADSIGGVLGLRLLSAALSTLAAMFVFLVAKRIFGHTSAMWAMLIFGLTGASISVGQLATYDVLSIAGLAIAFYAVVSAAVLPKNRETYYLFMGMASFILAVLAKYIALIYLPALCLIALTLYRLQGHTPWNWGLKFLLPVLLALSGYAWYNWSDLSHLVTIGFPTQPIARAEIFGTLRDEIGLVCLLAGTSCLFIFRVLVTRFMLVQRKQQVVLACIIFVVMSSLIALPLYHFLSGNGRALVKHTVFTLVLISPLAGYTITTMSAMFMQPSHRFAIQLRWLGAILTFLVLVWFGEQQLGRHRIFQNSWPNVAPVVEYLRSQGIHSQTRVLADGAEIYEYYLSSDDPQHTNWQRTWSAAYDGQDDLEAMRAGISHYEFDFVILDGYYRPEINDELVTALQMANYQLGYAGVESLGPTGKFTLRVYQMPRLNMKAQ